MRENPRRALSDVPGSNAFFYFRTGYSRLNKFVSDALHSRRDQGAVFTLQALFGKHHSVGAIPVCLQGRLDDNASGLLGKLAIVWSKTNDINTGRDTPRGLGLSPGLSRHDLDRHDAAGSPREEHHSLAMSQDTPGPCYPPHAMSRVMQVINHALPRSFPPMTGGALASSHCHTTIRLTVPSYPCSTVFRHRVSVCGGHPPLCTGSRAGAAGGADRGEEMRACRGKGFARGRKSGRMRAVSP